MNIIEILQNRIDNLPSGDHTPGVKSVLLHTEVAVKHLTRGREKNEITAFADAIYRTNQAYEGSLKEAYRILASKDPNHTTPNNIETYLQNENILRPRVLAQLSNYRKEWRNPSTHDYRLDFDEDEALLAIVTVSAFVIVLIDQIAGGLALAKAKEDFTSQLHPKELDESKPLREQFASLLPNFITQINGSYTADMREAEIVGALAGFIESVMPHWNVQREVAFSPNFRADIVISNSSEKLIVEVKNSFFSSTTDLDQAVAQTWLYMKTADITQAVVLGVRIPNGNSVRRRLSFGEHLPNTREVAYIDIVAATMPGEFYPEGPNV